MIKFRQAKDSDRNFIHNSWVKSAGLTTLASADLALLMPKMLPMVTMATIFIDGEESLVGWICGFNGELDCVLWAYVKEPFRKQGVFSALWDKHYADAKNVQYCFSHKRLSYLPEKLSLIFNPFFIARIS
jgi:hypothetical protein